MEIIMEVEEIAMARAVFAPLPLLHHPLDTGTVEVLAAGYQE
jgi:hypothetical protein